MKTYTVDEYARLFKVSRKTIYKLIRSGQLSARRFGRVLRIIDLDAPFGAQASADSDAGGQAHR